MLRTFYSDRLSDRQLGGMMRMEDAILNRRTDCVMYGIGADEVGAIVDAFINEHPEAYYCALQFIRQESTPDSTRLTFLYNDSCDEALFEQRFSEICADLDRHITPYTSEYEVAKRVYDHLASTVKLAGDVQDAFAEMQQNGSEDYGGFVREHGNAFTAYGALVEGRAVCMGFAMAYRLLLTHYGLDVACVGGYIGRVPHMLNAVTVGDRRAYVDVTRGVLCEGLPLVRYDLFLVPASRAAHFTANADLDCNGEGIDYFTQSGLRFRDLFALRRYLSSYIYEATGGEIRFCYTGGALNDDRLHRLAGELLASRCGTEYRMGNALIDGGIGTLQMLKN